MKRKVLQESVSPLLQWFRGYFAFVVELQRVEGGLECKFWLGEWVWSSADLFFRALEDDLDQVTLSCLVCSYGLVNLVP